MARWAPWGATKKFQVKLKSMKLQLHGFDINHQEQLSINKKNKNRDEAPTMATAATTTTMMGVEAIWKGPTSGFVSFHRKLNQVRNFSQQKRLSRTEFQVIEWVDEEDEFENICNLQIASSSKEEKTSVVTHSFHPWHVSFRLLLSGENEEVSSKDKMRLFGKGSLNLGSLASKWLLQVAEIEENVPIHLLIDGLANEATLSVTVSFTEIRSSHSRANSQDSMDVASDLDVQRQNLMRRVKSQGHRPLTEPNKKHGNKCKMTSAGREVVSSSGNTNSDESATFDSSSGYVVVTDGGKTVGPPNSVVELDRSSSSSEAQLSLIKKMAFWKWKRRRSSSMITNNMGVADDKSGAAGAKQGATDHATKDAAPISGTWLVQELVSRDDGKTKLKANVYFASYDQRSEKAAGESACTVIVAVMAHWLHENPETMPTSEHLNNLIIEGSSEWRKLCDHEAHKHEFPDRHFDIETVEAAGIRPIRISKEKSFHGLFNPEKFDCLKEMESFDSIWDKINENAEGEFGSSRVYIISWNDHFFILKMEADVTYIIDSLGERLYEGCNQAYILKFDESTVMYGRVEKKAVNGSGEEVKEGEKGSSRSEEEKEEDMMICRGKECCREYMKRFLAGIQLRELEEQEEKGIRNDPLYLCQRLQIDFHYTTTATKAAAAVSASPDTPLLFNGELLE